VIPGPPLITGKERIIMANAWEERRQARINRYLERAEKAEAEAERYRNSWAIRAVNDMMGEPVKIGHHSERRHRRLLERAERDFARAMELRKKAEYYRQRAEAVKRNKAVYSDDPEAIRKLKEKLAALEQAHEEMKRINAMYRKAKGDIDQMDIPDDMKEKLKVEKARWYMGPDNWRPFPSYSLQSNRAEIRRIKDRIAALEKATQEETKKIAFPGGVIIDNVEENRVQIMFDSIPAEEIRAQLKARGFRWSRKNGAWQRHRSDIALHWAKVITGAGE